MISSVHEFHNETEHGKILRGEKLPPRDLQKLLHATCHYLEERGFKVTEDEQLIIKDPAAYKNLITFNEDHLKGNEGVLLCASDGESLVYGDYSKYRNCSLFMFVFHVLHMSGHLMQWSCADSKCGLKYTGDKAWRQGQMIYEARKADTNKIITYEKEAFFLSIRNLEAIFEQSTLNKHFKELFREHYAYFSQVDLNALLQYFENYRHADIFKLNRLRIYNMNLGYNVHTDFRLKIVKRK